MIAYVDYFLHYVDDIELQLFSSFSYLLKQDFDV